MIIKHALLVGAVFALMQATSAQADKLLHPDLVELYGISDPVKDNEKAISQLRESFAQTSSVARHSLGAAAVELDLSADNSLGLGYGRVGSSDAWGAGYNRSVGNADVGGKVTYDPEAKDRWGVFAHITWSW